MPHTIKRTQKQRILSIIACFYILLQPTYGRDRQDYAENSILAEGNWVKISTTDAGIYQITEDSLRAWGFTDPSKIKLFGYGGTVIDELFANSDNYIDDLPQIPLWRHNNKLYFIRKALPNGLSILPVKNLYIGFTPILHMPAIS